jgi:chromosome partitioning protein
MQKKGFELLLKHQLQKIRHHYDYILIDTPPSMEFFTLNALMAADSVIIPTQCEYFSMNGALEIEKIIRTITEKYHYPLPYHLLINLFDPNNTAAQVILNQLNKHFNTKIYQTIIELDNTVQEAQIMHKPVITYANEHCKVVQQYQTLAKEVMVLG